MAMIAHEESTADRRARTVVAMLMARDGMDQQGLADVLGLKSRAAGGHKLTGVRRFTVAELARIAAHFEVDPGVFFEDPLELLSGRPRTSSEQSPSVGSGSFPRKSGWIFEGPTLVAA
jgi:hypothetical protein